MKQKFFWGNASDNEIIVLEDILTDARNFGTLKPKHLPLWFFADNKILIINPQNFEKAFIILLEKKSF